MFFISDVYKDIVTEEVYQKIIAGKIKVPRIIKVSEVKKGDFIRGPAEIAEVTKITHRKDKNETTFYFRNHRIAVCGFKPDDKIVIYKEAKK